MRSLILVTIFCACSRTEPATEPVAERLAEDTSVPSTPRGAVIHAMYPGPLGLGWGMSLDQVKAAFKGKFKPTRSAVAPSGIVQQWFSGDLYGLPTRDLELDFCDDHLGTALVTFSDTDERSIRWRWHQAADPMHAQWGQPTELTEPPEPPALPPGPHNEAAERARLDTDRRAIIAADGFHAMWEFPGRVAVVVDALPSNPDAQNRVQIQLTWMSLNDGALAGCQHRGPAAQGR